jgi:hypothetical protein
VEGVHRHLTVSRNMTMTDFCQPWVCAQVPFSTHLGRWGCPLIGLAANVHFPARLRLQLSTLSGHWVGPLWGAW